MSHRWQSTQVDGDHSDGKLRSIMTTQVHTPILTGLIDAVRNVVSHELPPAETATEVSNVLQEYLTQPNLVPDHYRQGDPERYRQHIIHAEPDGSFSLVALVWMPGQATPIHDHLAWCVAGVYEGAETETRYTLQGTGNSAHLIPTLNAENPAGIAVGLAPPGDIHHVQNTQDTPVISIHIYGANIDRLGTSVRRIYNLPITSA